MIDITVFSRCRFGLRSVSVTEYAVPDAFVVPGDTEISEDRFAFFGFEFFLCAMDPAAADTLAVGCEHQVAHDEAAVIKISAAALVSEHDQHYRCSVEWIYVGAHHGCVHAGELVTDGFVSYSDDYRRLLSHS